MTVPVEHLDVEPSGLAAMLGGIVEGNLREHPDRARLLAPPAVISIRVPDAETEVSIRLTPERVQIRDGLVRRRQVLVEADSQTLLGLSSVPLLLGLPDARTREGREVLGKLARRRLRVKGLLRHPGVLARLNKLLAVG